MERQGLADMSGRRSTKFYRKNEEEVMKSLGIEPTKNSGAGWLEKEDGQSEYVICQLKSTDARSIRIKQQDIHTLEYNASVSHKLPVFAVQFLNTGEVWLMVKPEDLTEIARYINTGKCEVVENVLEGVSEETTTTITSKTCVRSSEKARMDFKKEMEQRYKKEKKAW